LLPATLIPCFPPGNDQRPEDPSKHAVVVVQLESDSLFIIGMLRDRPHNACNVPSEVAPACNAQDMQDDLCGGGFHFLASFLNAVRFVPETFATALRAPLNWEDDYLRTGRPKT
jgi:hypothetical protein